MYSLRVVSGLPHYTTITMQRNVTSRKSTRRPQPNPPRPRAPRNIRQAPVVRAPVAMTRVQRGTGPTSSDTVTIHRREYLGDVCGSVTFATNSYAYNPGLPGSFPWLATIASNYEQFQVINTRFCYETEAPTSATGAIILSFDYDTLDSVPVDKTEALLVKDSVRAAPWVSCQLPLTSADLTRRGKLFTRSGSVASSDLKTYDLGRLSVSTVGQASTACIGELWVDYTIRFFVAQQRSPPGVLHVASTGVTDTAIFGTAPTTTGTTPVSALGDVLTFDQPGYFLLTTVFIGTGLNAGVSNTPTASTGATLTGIAAITNTADTNAIRLDVVRVLAGSTVTFDVSAATTVTAVTSRVSPWFSSSN